MATIKVKLRPSAVEGRAGTIYYQITHRRIIRQISTDIYIMTENWDTRRQRIIAIKTEVGIMQNRIDYDVSLLQSIVIDLDCSGAAYTVDNIIRLFRCSDNNRVFILAYMKDQIDYLHRCNRLGTARNYEQALKSFSQFLGRDIPLIAITEQLIEDYNAFLLQRGIVKNSVSFYMRVLRAVYNKAVRRHLVKPTNPFQNVYTGIDKTRKRAIDEKLIARIDRKSVV